MGRNGSGRGVTGLRLALIVGCLLALASLTAMGLSQSGAPPAAMGLSRSEARRPATGSHKYDRLVLSDEFSGPAGRAPDRGKWEAVVGGAGWGNHELETYTGSTANYLPRVRPELEVDM